jgi:hypothetical protein
LLLRAVPLHPVFPLLLVTCLIAGCSSSMRQPILNPDLVPVSGNWQLASSSPQAASLPQLSGALSGNSTAITGLFHTTASGACITPQTIVILSGKADAQRNLFLISSPFDNGSILTIRGVLAPDGHSMLNASYNVVGGACAFTPENGTSVAPMIAAQYQAISGSYAGNFVDGDGDSLPVTAILTQTTQPDANGAFHLTGNATFPGNPCLTAPVITDSTVTGSSLSATYSQQQNGVTNTVVASGTFNADASILTITNWTLSGGCGADNGTGLLTKQ